MSRFVWMAAFLMLAACQKSAMSQQDVAFDGAAPMGAAAQKRASGQAQAEAVGAMLAYEHDVSITIPAEAIPQRLQAARDACDSGRFGACVVLNVHQQGGDYPHASLGMRIVPAGVDPMIGLASAGATLGSRSTRAEDLAVVVRDNTQAQDRLRRELVRLQEFQQRRDLAVADMIALSKQLAETEAQVQAAEQEGAQHRRRIDTQLLTLKFQPPGGQSGRSEIAQALRDFVEVLSMGTAWTIRAIAFLIPLALVVALLVFVVRRWRRRKR